ncbi:RNA transcription, translation and transport factor protein-like [Diadema antillarum]|uniref:RNA transcription, translation and transport factor protein-like n=1 Tax=Diadema antillarum TaxID=105358 RepID=UPI003A8C090D
MFRRKLQALNYPSPNINVTDENVWRNLIEWLEDQKIRLYKIEDRAELRSKSSMQWPKAFAKYIQDLQCPLDGSDRLAVCDWLLGHAVRLEYGEKVQLYKSLPVGGQSSPGVVADDPFAGIEVSSPDVKAGLVSLCALLNIPRHVDPVVTLEAISLLIKERLSEEAQAGALEEGVAIDLSDYELGFDSKDRILNDAGRILRLLHINELRDLQTKINEAIVAVQSITADPKTDQRLGKVGR